MSRTWRKRWEHLDKSILVLTALLIGFGLVALYSASSHAAAQPWGGNFGRQLVWLVIGLVGFGVTVFVPPSFFRNYAYVIYAVFLALLVLLLFVGRGPGVARWIPLGPFHLQPSELAKVGLILALARYLTEHKRDLQRPTEVALAFALALVPMALVAKQPNLGTSLVFGALSIPMLFWAGLPVFSLFVILSPFASFLASFHLVAFLVVMALVIGVLVLARAGLRLSVLVVLANLGMAALAPVLWNHLHEYQQQRILTFLGLRDDPTGMGYQVIQSKVAVGSGGLFGKGLLHGTQTHLKFLPAQHTDFIFSVIGEELGFIGASFALFLFLLLIVRCLRVAAVARNRFNSLVVVGVVSVLTFHVFVNVGMVLGMMPVAGLPLPFMSYGGSFLLSCLVMMGLVVNVSMRWDEY